MSNNGSTIYIGDLPYAVVLAILYNNAVVEGFTSRLPMDGKMTVEMAQTILRDRTQSTYIEKYNSRFIGVDFSQSEFDPYQYNQENGQGEQLAEILIDIVRSVITPEVLAQATIDIWRSAVTQT